MTQLSPANDIKDLLVADGVTTTMFVSSQPTTPDTVITLYNVAGDPPSAKFLLDSPHLDIRSRSDSSETAYANLLEVFNLLLGRASFVKNTTRYTGIWAKTSIFDLGWDENNLKLLGCNFRLAVEPLFVAQNRKQL
jgi:hypothetical protein